MDLALIWDAEPAVSGCEGDELAGVVSSRYIQCDCLNNIQCKG